MVDYSRDQILGFAEEMRSKAQHAEKLLQVAYGESSDPYLMDDLLSEAESVEEYWQELGEMQDAADGILSDLEAYKVPDENTAARFDHLPADVRQTEFERLQQVRNDVIMLVLKYHEEYDRELPDSWSLEPEEPESWDKWWKDDAEIVD